MAPGIEIILLLAVAVVLLIRLIGVLGTRDGFEPKVQPVERPKPANDLRVVKNEPDHELEAYEDNATIRNALVAAKRIEPDFSIDDFLLGSKIAYERILMAYLNGDMSSVENFVDEQVLAGFNNAIAEREKAGEEIEAKFIGIKDVELVSAELDEKSKEMVLSVEYTAELSRVVRDADGKVISGDKNKVETELDHWQYARIMGSENQNWTLVATGE